VGKIYTRAVELCQPGGDTRQFSAALWGLYTYHTIRGQSRYALEMARQLLEMAERQDSPEFRINALDSMGFTLLCTGDIVDARPHLEALIALGRSSTSTSDSLRHGILNLFLGGMAFLSWDLWLLGCPDQAVERSREALELLPHISSAFTVALVKYFSADLHIFRGEVEEVPPLAAEQNVPMFAITGNFQLGWVAAEKGDVAAGIEAMSRALDARLATGSLAGSMTHFCFLATHFLDAGRFAEGLATVERALAISADGGHCLMDAELHRLKGELIQGLGAAADEIEDEFHRALEIARRQSARSLELRSAMSLARLWRRQGKKTEAHGLLAPVYEWFTEGFETRDLREARALLAEIG
jgi:adenylate cyclase